MRWHTAEALGSAFPHVTDKEQAWKDLLALTKDEHSDVRESTAEALCSAFDHVTDKEQVTKDLLALTKDEHSEVRKGAACAFGSALYYVTDKEQAWKDLLALIKDEHSDVRTRAAYFLGSALYYVTDKEQVTKDLLALIKDGDSYVRYRSRLCLFNIARNYLDEKDYEKTFQCFYGASNKSTFWEYINPGPFFYLCKGLGSYYHGRVVINELSNIEYPKEYIKNVKYAVKLFKKSIKNIEKSEKSPHYKVETRFFPICLNIYSAYYEYILSFQKLDVKRIAKVKKYLDEASEQCRLVGTEKGERTVKIFEKLAEALTSRLNEIIKWESAKKEVDGIAKKAEYEVFIEKSRETFEKHKAELENSLYEIEAPIIKKIAEFENKKLEKLKPEKGERLYPKSFWEKSRDFIVHKWEIIAALVAFLAALIYIIEKWEIISELIKSLL